MSIYKKLVNSFGWSLKEIDETSLETTMDFLFFNNKNPDVKVIKGKEYQRATKAPSWL